jgi:hypothetical protein
MNKIKLPSMVECLEIQQENSLQSATDFKKYALKFANFLSQQPNIGMFVPAVFENGKWRILNKPITPWQDSIIEEGLHQMYKKDLKQYQTALDNVIFEGFELNQKDTSKLENIICITLGKIQLTFFLKNKALFLDNLENNYTTKINTIEQLIPYNLTLTPKFAKKLGLI